MNTNCMSFLYNKSCFIILKKCIKNNNELIVNLIFNCVKQTLLLNKRDYKLHTPTFRSKILFRKIKWISLRNYLEDICIIGQIENHILTIFLS